ncbi:MAG: hypothetical protein NT040_08740 [Bacteroidetes bacterium]|nr:hypothetical protein [Bacteroidota bacterium]
MTAKLSLLQINEIHSFRKTFLSKRYTNKKGRFWTITEAGLQHRATFMKMFNVVYRNSYCWK